MRRLRNHLNEFSENRNGEAVLKKTMSDDFPKLIKGKNLHLQDTKHVSNSIDF